MPSTINRAYPYSALSDAPNGPVQLQALAEALDVDVQTIVNLFDGRLDALEAARSVGDTQNTSGTTSSSGAWTSTLTGGTACGVSFTAPLSGVVVITNVCGLSVTTTFAYCSFRLRTGAVVGSGSDVVADGLAQAFRNETTQDKTFMRRKRITGLTPGASYNVQQRFIVDGGSGAFVNKELIVEYA